jgi:hypothetical protein
MKVKKSVKIIIVVLIIIFCYLIYKFILFSEYSKYKSNVVHLTEIGTVLDDEIFNEVRYSKAIFLTDEIFIGNNFNSIIKENDIWKITDDNDVSYTLKLNEEKKDNYKDYKEMISSIYTISNEKYTFLTSINKLKKSINISKNIYKKLPRYNEIFLVDGNKKHGYIYKFNNEINAIIFVGDKKVHIIIDNANLEYDYIIDTLSTLYIDE